MSVTIWWWQIKDVGARIIMLATIVNKSQISGMTQNWITNIFRHRFISSPISVTNIDIATPGSTKNQVLSPSTITFSSRSTLNLIDEMRDRCIDNLLMLYRQNRIRITSFQSYPHLYIDLEFLQSEKKRLQ